jgi:hypothetical protein
LPFQKQWEDSDMMLASQTSVLMLPLYTLNLHSIFSLELMLADREEKEICSLL